MSESRRRARDFGIVIGQGIPGPNNAITDVAGVSVGYSTLIEGDDVRTGVTVIVPFGGKEALFAGVHRLNGSGEMTGWQALRELGVLTSPIGITNTYSVGIVHEGIVASSVRVGYVAGGFAAWSLPVVAETFDGLLNDIDGFHVRREHVQHALEEAHGGPVREGNVGGGTGMICHGFKGGTGTASRILHGRDGGYRVGVLVQANHGRRARFRVNGAPVGQEISPSVIPLPHRGQEARSSIIAVVATDAPLLPLQCDRLARRVGLGIGRTGGVGENSSGDIFLAFSTGNRNLERRPEEGSLTVAMEMLHNEAITPLFDAVVEATEEAIVNAMLAAETMTGRGGSTAYGLDGDLLVQILRRYDCPRGKDFQGE